MIVLLTYHYLNSVLLWIYAARCLVYTCWYREAVIYNDKFELLRITVAATLKAYPIVWVTYSQLLQLI